MRVSVSQKHKGKPQHSILTRGSTERSIQRGAGLFPNAARKDKKNLGVGFRGWSAIHLQILIFLTCAMGVVIYIL